MESDSSKEVPAREQAPEAGGPSQSAPGPPPAVEEPPAGRPTGTLNRRRMLSLLATAGAGVVGLFYWPRLLAALGLGDPADAREALRPKGKPRFRYKKTAPTSYVKAGMRSGFYERPSTAPQKVRQQGHGLTTVIHYVTGEGRMPFVESINERKLKPLATDAVSPVAAARSGASRPRVNSGRCSAVYEMAALRRVYEGKYDEACQLLVEGINQELLVKRSTGGVPSLRLLDLLATIAVRRGYDEYIRQLNGLAGAEGPLRQLLARRAVSTPAARKRNGGKAEVGSPAASVTETSLDGIKEKRLAAFDARVARWQNPDGEWYRKRRDVNERVFWSMPVSWKVNPPEGVPPRKPNENFVRYEILAAPPTPT